MPLEKSVDCTMTPALDESDQDSGEKNNFPTVARKSRHVIFRDARKPDEHGARLGLGRLLFVR